LPAGARARLPRGAIPAGVRRRRDAGHAHRAGRNRIVRQALRPVRAAPGDAARADRLRLRGRRPPAAGDRPGVAPVARAGLDARAPAREADDARQRALDAGAEYLPRRLHAALRHHPAVARSDRAFLSRALEPAPALSAASLARAALMRL